MWRLGRPEMWQDELVTIDVAARPRARIAALVANTDAVHALYYFSMHYWVRIFGESPVAMRLPSALAMVAASACVALIGRRLFDRRSGVLAGLLFAIIPSVTRFAQEARSYAFVVLAAALATLLLLRALDRSRVWRWVAYAASVTLIVCLNAVAVTIVIGQLGGVLIRAVHERRARPMIVALCAAVGGVLPAIPVLSLGSDQANGQVAWIPDLPPWKVWPQIFASHWLGWAVLLFAILVWVRRERLSAAFGTAVAVIPLPVVWLASRGELDYFFSKYLLFILPAWAVLAGAGLAALRFRVVSAVALAGLLVLAVPGQRMVRGNLSHSWYTYPMPRPSQPLAYADAARIIGAGYRPGDGVAYLRDQWWVLVDAGVNYYLPDRARPRDVFDCQTGSDAASLHEQECQDPAARFGAPPRLWVVVPGISAQPATLFNAGQRGMIERHYTQQWAAHPAGMTVALLVRAR